MLQHTADWAASWVQEETEEGKLVGKKIEVEWKDETFDGVVAAFDPFEGTVRARACAHLLSCPPACTRSRCARGVDTQPPPSAQHTVTYEDGDSFIHNLDQCKWRPASKKRAAPPAAAASPAKAAKTAGGKKASPKAPAQKPAKATKASAARSKAATSLKAVQVPSAPRGAELVRVSSIGGGGGRGVVPVDPESGLAAVAHVYTDGGGSVYDCELGLLDLSVNSDKYYKLQVRRSSPTACLCVWVCV